MQTCRVSLHGRIATLQHCMASPHVRHDTLDRLAGSLHAGFALVHLRFLDMRPRVVAALCVDVAPHRRLVLMHGAFNPVRDAHVARHRRFALMHR